MRLKYEVKKSFEMPSGGKVTVTVGSDDPINESDYFVLREDAAQNMAMVFKSLADTMKPKTV
jgi:hypothetical protein